MEIRVVLISENKEWSRDLKALLGKEAAEIGETNLKVRVYEKVPSLEEAVVYYAPHLIVIHFGGEDNSEKMDFLEHLRQVAERIPTVVSAAALEADFMLSCVKKGVRDFLKIPLDSGDIKALVQRLFSEGKRTAEEESSHGETISFFSYKGGIGTTFLSSNTAVALAKVLKKRVLLWDLVFQNGDIPFFFDYDPPATLTDLLENISRIDDSYLMGVLPPHSSGISILPAFKRPEDAESIRADKIQQLHQILRKFYDYIVVDAGHVLTDPVISILDNSKHIFLTTDLHLPVLKNTLRCLDVFERLGYVSGKFRVLLNRYNSKYEKFDLSKAEEILHQSITYYFSNDYVTASRSLNAGIPVAELDRNSVLAKQFEGFARLIADNFEVREKRLSLMEKLFKGKGPSKGSKKADSKEKGVEEDAA